ncbi:MAG: alpha-amylase [Prosthecochloris sp.]|nr:alpha-amylase [Prosthecochloris sp.]
MFPLVYEINTRVWLHRLSIIHEKPVTLGTVPDKEFDFFKTCGFDIIWLMGVWKESLYSQAIARSHDGLRTAFLEQLEHLEPQDVAGSPYSIPEYSLNPVLGEEEELEEFRKRLRDCGIRLMLDFVPNHLALDNKWLPRYPEYFVTLSDEEHYLDPGSCFEYKRDHFLAHGKDPYFPAWTDTLQLNYANPATHDLMTENLLSISRKCDAVRCDVAMLILKSVFDTTWSPLSGPMPYEFWPNAIKTVKSEYPGFLFLAESYWNKEWELQQQGFDYTYDKQFYDYLTEHPVNITRLREHLKADWDYQSRLCLFLENHDEPRAAKTLGPNHLAGALLMLTSPGMHLIHQGQLEGFKRQLPVQLLRQASEPFSSELPERYRQLFKLTGEELYTKGKIEILPLNVHDTSGCIGYRRHLNGESAFILANFSSIGVEINIDHQQLVHLDRKKFTIFSTHQNKKHSETCQHKKGTSIRLSPHEAVIIRCQD